MVANILRGDNTRSSAIGNNNTAGDYFFNNVSGNKTTHMRLKNGGNLDLGINLTNNAPNTVLKPDAALSLPATLVLMVKE